MTDSMFAASAASETFVERHTPWQLPADPSQAHRLHSSWVSLMNARSDSLCALRRVESGDDHVRLVHHVPTQCVPLSAIRERGPLRLGQVLAVGVRIADALTALHDERTAHGDVGLDTVLVSRTGQVWLGGSGLWTMAPNAGGPVAADDIRDLALLMQDLIGPGSFPTAIELVLMKAQDPDPFVRPSLHDLTSTLLRRPRREVEHPVARDLRDRARASESSSEAPLPRSALPQPKPRSLGLGRLRPRIT